MSEVTSPLPERPAGRGLDPVRATPLAVLFIAPVLLTVYSMGPLHGPDSFWHLALGRALASTWTFGADDPLSSATTQPWVYNQWLTEVLASWAERLGGLAAVAWIASAGRLCLLVTLWVICRRRAGTLAALLAALVATIGTFGAWDARPQLAGVVCMAIAAGAAWSTVVDGRPRWWLVPFTWLWACVHGTWTLGVALGVLVAAAALLDRRADAPRAHLARFAVPLACAAAAALTPVGPRLYTTLTAISGVSGFIQEWQPAPITTPQLAATLAGAVAVALSWCRRRPEALWGRLALLAFALALALAYARTIAVAAVVVAPLLAEAVGGLAAQRRRTSGRREAAWLGVGVAAALVVAAVGLSGSARLPSDAPTALDARLATASGPIFNDQRLGGWLLWAHPNVTPVIDTRWEAYGRQASERYLATEAAGPGWQSDVDASGARLALLDEGSPLAAALQSERGWRVIGSDRGYVLLAPA